MKKVKAFIGIVVLLIFVYLYAHIAKMNMIYDKKVDSSEYLSTGVVAGTIEQEFICKEDTLDGISAKCQLIGDTTDSKVRLTLIEKETGKVAAEVEVNAGEMKNGKFNKFSFDTITDCKGKTFKVVFENSGANIEDGVGIGFVYQQETEKGTKLTINHQDTQGTLILKTITNRFDIETFCVLLLLILYIIVFVKFLYRLFAK